MKPGMLAKSTVCAAIILALAGSVVAAAPGVTGTSTATGTSGTTGISAAASTAAPKPKTAKSTEPPVAAPWTGSWSGTIDEVGRASSYPIEITLTAKGGETSYPGQNCAGKLSRVAAAGDYAFFLETITTGRFDPATKAGCLDGSLTLQKSSDGLVMTWMTGYNGKAVVAYGPLEPKAK